MQRVNEAYGRNNLLRLLELQLELEHIDQHAINNLSDERLKHYNRILKEQLAELDQEILQVEAGFRMRYGIPPYIALSPHTVMRNLAANVVEVQRAIRAMEIDLLAFDELKQFKLWLKEMRRRQTAPQFDDRFF
jgi:hypothetical protein